MTSLDALYRMQRAWEATQPQLFMTDEVLWPDALDEREAAGLKNLTPGCFPLVERMGVLDQAETTRARPGPGCDLRLIEPTLSDGAAALLSPEGPPSGGLE